MLRYGTCLLCSVLSSDSVFVVLDKLDSTELPEAIEITEKMETEEPNVEEMTGN